MKIRTNRDDFNSNCIIFSITDVYLNFDDNTQVHLQDVQDYSFMLINKDESTMEFTSGFLNIDLQNQLTKNTNIIYIEIKMIVVDYETGELLENIIWEIPCNMKFKESFSYGDKDNCGEFHISLEGMIM